jgi:threonylcarbamoyladenosine tRNA methylthiotransferase MtaB
MHADAIVGFPTEDDAAWRRSIEFIHSLDLAGLHVFRYSPRPGTAATRMTGLVDEPTKKHRAAELLAVAADARAGWAAAHVGGRAVVLLEHPLDDGWWVGHAADHALVAVSPPRGGDDLENAIAVVAVDAVDEETRDRVVGRIVSLSPAARTPEALADAG